MNRLDGLLEKWYSLMPLSADDERRLERKFMLEFNYNSNHIEGNTLTYGQTELLLLFGKVVNEANMKDLEEMKAHNVCLQMMLTQAHDKESVLSETFIRQLHRLCFGKIILCIVNFQAARRHHTWYTPDVIRLVLIRLLLLQVSVLNMPRQRRHRH